jgi:hypothetical protein
MAAGKDKPVTVGHIDCPTCGLAGGMAIKHDKNGDAFGFCEDCTQQLFTRNGHKSKLLLRRMRPVTAVTEPDPAPVAPSVAVAAPVAVPVKAAPAGAGGVKTAPPVPEVKPVEKTSPVPDPAVLAPKKAAWFQPIIGKSQRTATA